MKVEVRLDGIVPDIIVAELLIIPETDFDEACLKQFGAKEKKLKAFLKYGISYSDFLGLKIKNI